MGITTGKYWISRSISALSILLFALLVVTAKAYTPPAGVTLISCDRSGAVIEVKIPGLHSGTVIHDGRKFCELSIPGWCHLDEEGKPSLPLAPVMLAMPPGAKASLAVEALETRTASVPDPLPTPTVKMNLQGTQSAEVFRTDPAVYASSSFYPQNWASLGEPVWVRTFWAVPVRITPVRVQAGRGQALVAGRLRLRISFQGGRPGHVIADPFGEPMAKQTLLNFQQARSWQERSSTALMPLSSSAYGKYKVYVNNDGIRIITHDDLIAAGISPDTLDQLNPLTFKMKVKGRQGQVDTLVQVPIWVEGEWDGHFDANDYILFFGNFARGQYTYENKFVRANTYWLDWGGTVGTRMSSRVTAPTQTSVSVSRFKAHTRTELDTIYEKFGFAPEVGADTIDHWLWYLLDFQYRPSLTILQNLPGHLKILTPPNLYSYTLTVSVRGYTLNLADSLSGIADHRVIVKWNNTVAMNDTFDRQEPLIASAAIAPDWLYPTDPNVIEIDAPYVALPPPLPNSFYLDWTRVDYWRDFSVIGDTLLFQKPQDKAPVGLYKYQLTGIQESNPDSIELWNLTRSQRDTGFTFDQGTLTFQDSSLTDSTVYYLATRRSWLPADSIVRDVPSDWKNPNQHYDYLMITHDDFYDALTPLVNLYTSRGMAVARVKLSDIYDEFNFGMKDPQAIKDFVQYAYYLYQGGPPTYVLLVGDASWDYKNYDPLPYIDYCPTHHFWTYKWGETASDNYFAAVSGNDVVPDLYLGRLPVNNADEINLMVQKSLLYAQAPPGHWRSTVTFSNGAYGPDDAVSFDTTAALIINQLFPPWYNPPRIYLHPSPGFEQFYGDETNMIQTINQGTVCINYQGHAGNQLWETLSLQGIASLTNGVKLPFAQGYSCFTGIFSNTRGFGEAFILQPGGGAIAYFSNGAIGRTLTNENIDIDMMSQLITPPDTTGGVTFGRAATQAKVFFYSGWGTSNDVVVTFVLLGDPGSRFLYEAPDPADTADNKAPLIHISFGSKSGGFRNGDFVSNPVHMTCAVFDSTVIDTASLYLKLSHLADDQGHPVSDSVSWSWWPNTPYPPGFSSVLSDSQHFTLNYSSPSTGLAAGEWQFIARISDLFNNSAGDTVIFNVGGQALTLDNVLNYPNPTKGRTEFTFSLSDRAEVTIKIYTVAGRLVRTLQEVVDAGYNRVPWDGRDERGDPLSNGVYIYKINAFSGDRKVEKIQKLAVLK